jgi:protein ImuB
MCVWFPDWPIQRLQQERAELRRRPLVLYALAGGKMLVTVCSRGVARQGVRAGMSVAEARALEKRGRSSFSGIVLSTPSRSPAPKKSCVPFFLLQDLAADRAGLRQLAVWCQRFSPLVAVEDAEPPDSLLLDVTGCGPCFGGEPALAEKVVAVLRRRGYRIRAAMADTIGAAWAIAHYGAPSWDGLKNRPTVVPPGEQAKALDALPVESLRFSPPVVQRLRELDIRRIQQLLALPRAELPCRFGQEVVHRLDQALGMVPELMTAERTAESAEASWTFDPPTAECRAIDAVLNHLLEQVLESLRPRHLGVQQLHCSLQTTPGGPVHFQVGLLQASASLPHLIELVRPHLERIRVCGEVSAIAVRAAVAVPLEFHQRQIFDEDEQEEKKLPVLIERLSHRLGEKSVLRPRLLPDAQPELAWRYEPWLRQPGQSAAKAKPPPPSPRWPFSWDGFQNRPTPLLRPMCLKCQPMALSVVSIVPDGPPLRFQWKNRNYIVGHAWGPERIETGWWRGSDIRRDYYLVETTTGERFWLFRTRGDEAWFLHGTFA